MHNHLLWLLLPLSAAACSDPSASPNYSVLEAQVRATLERELKVGSSEQEIKNALDAVGAGYSYDDFYHCYAGTIPASRQQVGGVKSVIWLRVYMDGERKFTKSEVETILTYL